MNTEAPPEPPPAPALDAPPDFGVSYPEPDRPMGSRIPPHNTQAEESVLGAMLLTTDAIGPAMEIITDAGYFYSRTNGYIFDAIAALYSDGAEVDLVTVSEQLQRANVLRQIGGEQRLRDLQAATPVAAHAERYARIVEENALLRKLISVSGQITDLGYSAPENVTAALDEAESMIYSITERRLVDSTQMLHQMLDNTLDHLDAIYGDGLVGLSTGFKDLDDLLGGLQPSTLNVVGARPSMGKTAFALTMAASAALESQRPVLFFSLEMGHLELTTRLLAAHARVDSKRLQRGNPNDEEWARVGDSVEAMRDAKMWVDDNPNLTVTEIRTKARRISREVEGGLGLIVVDYLQLMSGRVDSENRQVDVAEMSRGLKVLARELEVPVLALSQLNRTLEQRSDKRPMLSDLRESGAIEQDADVVMLLYRDEEYNDDSENKGGAEVIVAKHRNGPTGKIDLAFLPQYACFANASRVQENY